MYAGAGVIGNTFDPGTAGIGTHEIVYTFSDVNGCFASDTSIVVVDICTGISDPHATDILVFPNPGNGIFGITGMRSGVHMRVLDALGREVMRMMATSTPMELDGRDWPSGVYSLWLEGDDRRVLRVVKQ